MSTATATLPAPTMEIVLDQGAHKHLRFRRMATDWEVHLFPGGFLVRRFAGCDFVFVTGAEDIIASMAFTEGDPVYWADKLTAGTARSWDYGAFTEWLLDEAHHELDLDYEEIDELLRGADLSTERRAREVVADDFQGLAFPDSTIDLYYSLDSRFLLSLHAARQGLALYAAQS
ncbi:hypothetical protein [Nocardiopsis sp. L17-MgMaSL7]|uniref:hypothetical protein n=1 Tax=Nocardiopsis sp. L17-MgMaSL7 TaxID=1938893 RepID=UPI000D71851E|nr:hypothetical protein [Nocardiopsis sp. L17-MgMaSL7]PWV44572.1 hypothetical protein BDW27_12331 [Nocardiopsis sp. L17-MgMaSL7]